MTNSLTAVNILFLLAGLVAGLILTAIVLNAKMGQLRQRHLDEQNQLKQQIDLHSQNLNQQQAQREQLLETNQVLQEKNAGLVAENASLSTRLDAERLRFQEQIKLLQETRENLSREFENLANRIFEAKTQQFSVTSKQSLETTINPLREEISSFRKKVEDAYDKENAERNKLAGQVIELQKQAQRVGEDAVQLAKALKGDSKMQGNWGEVVLERILEESGLKKGREYETQVALKDSEGQRRNPDVVVHLPEGRDIVIDAKVSLTDYERYCREEDESQKQQFLKGHIGSIRSHVTGLNRKAYEQLDGVNTLDFVLIFVPIEAAFMLALEHDHTLFRDAYDKGIILVSPTTLLATLRTIHNIWRYEAQNRNAEQIAEKAGKLYDQLVLVVDSLDEVGKHLERSQDAWLTTRKRLVAGRGNLVKQVEDMKRMGARSRKSLPDSMLAEAYDNDESFGSEEALDNDEAFDNEKALDNDTDDNEEQSIVKGSLEDSQAT